MTKILALALWGCSPTDPDLRSQARSLEAWEQGRAALDAGDAATARERFREAYQAWPSPLIGAWEARALASTGRAEDLEAAVVLLEAVLRAKPRFAEARYNRAAYLLRLEGVAPAPGRIEHAAAELQQALADAAAEGPASSGPTSRAVLADPDFAAALRHPAFDFLPREALSLEVQPPPETAFWGAEVVLGLRLIGAVEPPITVSADQADGPLELVSVFEDVRSPAEGEVAITWTWRVIGAGPAVIGPLAVKAGGDTVTAPAVRVDASAPPDRAAPSRTLSLALPSALVAAVEPRSAAVVDGTLVVRVRPTDRVEVDPPGEPPARYERREAGVPVDVVWRWPSATPATVRIRDGSGAEVFSGPPLGN